MDDLTELEKARADYALLTNDYEELAYEVMELRALVGEKTLAMKHADVAHRVGVREIKRVKAELKALRLTVENIKSECVQGRCDEKTFNYLGADSDHRKIYSQCNQCLAEQMLYSQRRN